MRNKTSGSREEKFVFRWKSASEMPFHFSQNSAPSGTSIEKSIPFLPAPRAKRRNFSW